VTDRASVSRWLAGYEAAWRAPGTGDLARLFTGDATYRQSPYEQPVIGLDAIKRMWDEEREGPDEVFTLTTDILAVDGLTAVVRAEVRYGNPASQEYRDLWIIRLADDGQCTWFEEWPYWPGRPYTPPVLPACRFPLASGLPLRWARISAIYSGTVHDAYLRSAVGDQGFPG
jgi:ketosteroid isomerase-like protein